MLDRRNPRQNDRRESNRRLDDRFESPTGIRFLRAGSTPDDVVAGRLLDISASGIRLLLDERLDKNQKMLVEVRSLASHCFNLMAEVVWADPTEDGRFLVGCELCVDLSATQYALLKQMATAAYSISPK